MGSKMLIDAAHPEETRVVVVRNKRVEDFDYESASRKQLRGNIYLAKVTRVEPSLQAAFVDYGGNRHGFLAFSEIHPDYYQIPVADRQALLDEEAEEQIQAEAEEAAQDESAAASPPPGAVGGDNGLEAGLAREEAPHGDDDDEDEDEDDEGDEDSDDDEDDESDTGEDTDARSPARVLAASDHDAVVVEDIGAPAAHEAASGEAAGGDLPAAEARRPANGGERGRHRRRRRGSRRGEELENGGDSVDSVGSEDALEEVPERVRKRRRMYKIQEVIRRRQIILVQVVKEERGNKGAALTTYLSLAGRYTVLMPNTGRGGGISRKIGSTADRKRLRTIASELEVPEGMGLIIRTAGASRTKAEVKRDYEYLLRLWENVRDLTLKSTAPTLVYEEGNLLKRSIRDLYNKDIDEILVAGDEAYKEAKDFMRMLMPSHAKNVKPYKEPEPIFVRHQVERQLSAMFSPYVTLKSGGYIVINQTEALVSIDVNSGKATREHNIEDTALKTNLEAAEEIARQLRLRDLAGLIVIDFIDMDERRNNRSVERKLKECLRNERARIQVGRISHFGLLEMSRQRLRAGMLEGTTTPCPMCTGAGIVRSTESVALDVLRSMEDMLLTQGVTHLTATAPVTVALYILNQKRHILRDIEQRYGISINVDADDSLHGGNFRIEKAAAPIRLPVPAAPALADASKSAAATEDADEADEAADETAAEVEFEPEAAADADANGDGGRRRRRRRRRRRGERADSVEPVRAGAYAADLEADEDNGAGMEDGAPDAADDEDRQAARGQPESEAERDGARRRRRGRRGGRRSRGQQGTQVAGGEGAAAAEPSDDAMPASGWSLGEPGHEPGEPVDSQHGHLGDESGGGREPEALAQGNGGYGDLPLATGGTVEAGSPYGALPAHGQTGRHKAAADTVETAGFDVAGAEADDAVASATVTTEAFAPDTAAQEEPATPRRGWWQRRLSG